MLIIVSFYSSNPEKNSHMFKILIIIKTNIEQHIIMIYEALMMLKYSFDHRNNYILTHINMFEIIQILNFFTVHWIK